MVASGNQIWGHLMNVIRLINNDCKAAMAEMKEDCVGSVICDPPYG